MSNPSWAIKMLCLLLTWKKRFILTKTHQSFTLKVSLSPSSFMMSKLLILVPLLSSREGDGTALAFWGCRSAREGWWRERVWERVTGMGGIGQVLVGSHSLLWPSFKYSWSLWPCQVQYPVFWLFACHIVYISYNKYPVSWLSACHTCHTIVLRPTLYYGAHQ